MPTKPANPSSALSRKRVAAKAVLSSRHHVTRAVARKDVKRTQLSAEIECDADIATEDDLAALLETPRDAFIMIDGVPLAVRIFTSDVAF